MESLRAIPILLVFGLLFMAVYQGKKPLPNKGDQVPLPVTNRTYYGIEVRDDTPKADIEVTHLVSGDKWGISLYDDGVFQPPKQATNSAFSYTYEKHFKPLAIGLDLGWWGGIRQDRREEDNALDMGIRIAPAKIAYGVLSPDLLIGTESLGIGCSAYLPKDIGRGVWKKIGIGGAWMAGYHGGGGWMPYLALTTTF